MFEISTVINRPVEDVFAVLSNVENNLKWSASFLEVQKTSPESIIGLGTTWRAVQKLFGQRIESEFEVTDYEANRKFAVITKSGPVPIEIRTTFEPVAGGTRVRRVFDDTGKSRGFFKLAEPLLLKMGKSRFEADLATLKRLMENRAL